MNDGNCKGIDESKLVELKEMFMLNTEGMGIEEMHALEYSNRLAYIGKIVDRKKGKFKNINVLGSMVEA